MLRKKIHDGYRQGKAFLFCTPETILTIYERMNIVRFHGRHLSLINTYLKWLPRYHFRHGTWQNQHTTLRRPDRKKFLIQRAPVSYTLKGTSLLKA